MSPPDDPRRRRWWRWLRATAPGQGRRPPAWPELLLIAWLGWLYDDLANLAPLRAKVAYAHAASVWHVEQLLHVDPERAMNQWLAGHPGLGLWVGNYYDNLHFIATFAMLGLLYWRFPRDYRPLRNGLVALNLIGFLVFWLWPMAPPRLLPGAGFVDVVGLTHAFGSWTAGSLAHYADQLAAMPSLHMAWATWSALVAWRLLRRGRWRWRWLVWAYPLITAIAVLATANHFVMDVLAGCVDTAVATVIGDEWHRRWSRWSARRRATTPELVPVAAVVEPAEDRVGALDVGE